MRLLIAIAAALALAGCTTTPDQDATIARNVRAACSALDTAYVSFTAFADAGLVPSKTVAKVEAAEAGVRIICADPDDASGLSAVIRVSAATAVVIAAMKSAS